MNKMSFFFTAAPEDQAILKNPQKGKKNTPLFFYKLSSTRDVRRLIKFKTLDNIIDK